MVSYVHWEEEAGPDQVCVQPYPSRINLDGQYTSWHDDQDQASEKLRSYFGWEAPLVAGAPDAMLAMVITTGGDAAVAMVATGMSLTQIAMAVGASGRTPPPGFWTAAAPDPGFPTVGDPVPLGPGEDSTKRAKEEGWQWYATAVDQNGTVWLFQQDDADRFWVGGGSSANWDATANTNWSATSGGANNASVPVASDTQTFDANGNSACTVNVAIPALTTTTVSAGYTATITVSTAQTSGNWGATTLNAGTFANSGGGSVVNIGAAALTIGGATIALGAGEKCQATGAISITSGTWTSGVLVHSISSGANLSSSLTITQVSIAGNGVTSTLTAGLTFSTSLTVAGQGGGSTGTLAAAAQTLTGTGTSTITVGTGSGSNGSITFTTGTLDTGTGAVTIGTAAGSTGSLGSNTAWTFTQDGALTVAATGTLSAPNASGTWTGNANITTNTSSTLTPNSGTMTVATSLSLSPAGFSYDGTGNYDFYSITVNISQTLTVSATTTTRNVLTVNGTLTGSQVNLAGSNATPLVLGGSSTITGSFVRYSSQATAINVAAGTYGALALLPHVAAACTMTPSGNIVCTSFASGNDSGNFLDIYSGGTTNLTQTTTATIGQAANNYKCSMRFSTGQWTGATTSTLYAGSDITYSGAGTFTQTQEMTCNGTFTCAGQNVTISIASSRATATFGLGVAGTANLGTGSVTLGSLDLLSGAAVTMTSGTCTINGRQSGGTTMRFGSTGAYTFTHNSGTVAVTQAVGTALIEAYNSGPTFSTLTNNTTANMQLYTTAGLTFTATTLNANSTGTFDCGTTNTGNLTVSGVTTVVTAINCRSGTCSFGSGYTTGPSLQSNGTATFTGGSGTHTIGSISWNNASSSFNFSSGTTTVDSADTSNSNRSIVLASTATTAHNNGTVTFTRAGTMNLNTSQGGATGSRTLFYNWTVNNASAVVGWGANKDNLTVANNFTVTAGSWTNDSGLTFTVTATTSISGTYTENGINSLGSGSTTTSVVNIASGGTLSGGTNTNTFGNINVVGAWTATSGTTTINSYGGDTAIIKFQSGFTFTHNSGLVQCTHGDTNQRTIELYGANPTFYNLTTNNAGAGGGTATYDAANSKTVNVANNLTVTAGIYNCRASTGCNLAVTGLTSVTGTFQGQEHTLSLGSGVTSNYTVRVENGGTFTGGSGTHTMGSIGAGGTGALTITLSSGATTIDSATGSVALNTEAGTTWSHANGSVTFTRAGNQWLRRGDSTAQTTFYNWTINNASASVQFRQNTGYNLTIANNFVATAGTFTVNEETTGTSRNLTVTGTSSVTGTVTPGSTSAITLNGATTINSGGVFGGNSAYVLDSNAAFTVSAGGTFNSASSGNMTHSGNLTGSTTMTWNQNGGTTVLDGTSQTISGFTNNTTTTVLGNLNIQTSTRLTLGDASSLKTCVGSGTSQSVVITFNMAGDIQNSSGTPGIIVRTSSANPIVATSMPTTWNDNATFQIIYNANGNLPASSWTKINLLDFIGADTITITQTGTVTQTSLSTARSLRIYANAGATTFTYSLNSRALTCDGLVLGITASSRIATMTVTTGTLTENANGTTVATSSSLGSNTAWTFDSNGPLVTDPSSTLLAPNASGTFNCSGNVTLTNGTFTHDNGTLNFDGASAQNFASGSQTYYNLSFSAAAATVTHTTGSPTVVNGITLTAGAARVYAINSGVTITHQGSTAVGTSTKIQVKSGAIVTIQRFGLITGAGTIEVDLGGKWDDQPPGGIVVQSPQLLPALGSPAPQQSYGP